MTAPSADNERHEPNPAEQVTDLAKAVLGRDWQESSDIFGDEATAEAREAVAEVVEELAEQGADYVRQLRTLAQSVLEAVRWLEDLSPAVHVEESQVVLSSLRSAAEQIWTLVDCVGSASSDRSETTDG